MPIGVPNKPDGSKMVYRAAVKTGVVFQDRVIPAAAPAGVRRIVVMGVCGCGKSTVGAALAQSLGLRFVEGDSLHPPANVARMAQGTPLTDADRAEWLDAVAQVLREASRIVVSCSALKRSYRDRLRAAVPGLHFVHLSGTPAELERRMSARSGHYMPASLLQSQLDTLEPPAADEAAITLDIDQLPETLVAQARLHLKSLE